MTKDGFESVYISTLDSLNDERRFAVLVVSIHLFRRRKDVDSFSNQEINNVSLSLNTSNLKEISSILEKVDLVKHRLNKSNSTKLDKRPESFGRVSTSHRLEESRHKVCSRER
jgi:hypothetical protein